MSPPLPSDAVGQVKAFVQDFKANRHRPILAADEEREFKISFQDWTKLCNEFGLNEDRDFYEYSYDTSKSILTIKGHPSDVHEAVVQFLTGSLYRAIPSTPHVQITTAGEIRCDEGQYKGSQKVPDLGIQEEDSEGNWKIKWALEVGFSEEHEKLKSEMELMLKGKASEMIQCALVKITETPKYRCPVSKEEEIKKQDWKDPRVFKAKECHGEEYGPIFYQGRQWVGKISNIFWETWQFDVETNEVKQVGKRYTIYPPSTTSEPFPPIQLDQILSNSPTTKPLLLDWTIFRTKLQRVMTALVLTRYQDWYYERQKKEVNDPKDQDDDEEEEEEEEEKEETEKGRKVKERRLNPSRKKKV